LSLIFPSIGFSMTTCFSRPQGMAWRKNQSVMIQMFQVHKEYGNQVYALRDINLHIEKGEFVFLVGPSGAGKTTLMRLIFRDESPTSGSILIDGRNIERLSMTAIPYLR